MELSRSAPAAGECWPVAPGPGGRELHRRRAANEDRDVNALLSAAVVLLLAIWGAAMLARRRAARRAAAREARVRARRRKVPVVSANVRGLPGNETDLWVQETQAASRDGRAT
jgi:hypothetical protein